MALVKTVELKILANAGDAQGKIDDLAAKGRALDGNEIKMRFRLDGDRDVKTQLDEIRAKATGAGFGDVRIKVKVDGAGRAIADLAAVKHEAEAASGGGILGRLGGLLGGVPSAAGGLPLVGGIAGSGPFGLAAVGAGLAALLPEVVAVGSGFAAAGAGAAAFAALALPAVHKVEEALKATPKKLAKLLPGMDPNERSALTQIRGLEETFKRMSRAFEPQGMKIFADSLRVISGLLPALAPMANAFANALHPLLQQLAAFTQSAGFKQWLQQFTSLIGPATTSIGQGIGQVVNAFGKLLTSFSGKDVAHGINIAFGAVTGIINGVRVAIEGLKRVWDNFSRSPAGSKIVDEIKKVWDSISQGGKGGKKPDFSALTDAVKTAVNAAVSWLNQKLGPLINSALNTASKWLTSHSGVLKAAGAAIMQGFLDGMQSKIPSLIQLGIKITGLIAKYKGPIEKDRVLLHPAGQAIIGGLMLGMESMLPALKKHLEKTAQIIKAEIQQSVQVAQAALSEMSIMNAAGAGPSGEGPPGATTLIQGMQFQLSQVRAFAQQIAQLKHMGLNSQTLSQIIGAGVSGGLPIAQSITGGGKDAVSQINQLEKQLRAAAGKLGDASAGPMYQAGVQSAQGLAAGLKSQLGTVQAAIRQLVKAMVAAVKDGLKIKSPSLVMRELGQYSGHGLELGLRDSAPRVSAASRTLAGAAAGGYASGAAGMGRGGGDGMHVHFHSVVATPQDARKMVQVLREYKRTGGNAALGIA